MARKKAVTQARVNHKSHLGNGGITNAAFAAPPITTVSDRLIINGYLVEKSSLDRIVSAARRAVNPDFPDQCVVRVSATLKNNVSRLQFNDTSTALTHFDQNRIEITAVTLCLESDRNAQLEIAMQDDGIISLSGVSDRPDFSFHIDPLKRELHACDQRFPAIVKLFAYSQQPLRVVTQTLALASIFLLGNVLYYIHALNVGVDVDPKVIPEGNQYFQEIESVLQSGTDSEKIDAILRSQFLHFTNVSSVLDTCRLWLMWSLAGVGLSIGGIFLIRSIRRLYPKAFFAFGPSVQLLQQLVRRREVFSVGIVIAFIINIIAGIVVALLLA
jgi:hypothetical protein